MEFLEGRKDLRDVDVKNTWKLLLTEKEIQATVKKCAKIIKKQFEGKDIVIACILKGAVYFFTDLTRQLTIPYSCYFIEASSYKNQQTQDEEVEILSKIVPEKFSGKHVILIDELFDNGNTLTKVKLAISEKAKVPLDMIFTCAMFEKNKPTIYPKPDLFGISVPDVWLVGYGLDDKQEKRGWKCLFACPKSADAEKSPDDQIFTDEKYYSDVMNQIHKKIA